MPKPNAFILAIFMQSSLDWFMFYGQKSIPQKKYLWHNLTCHCERNVTFDWQKHISVFRFEASDKTSSGIRKIWLKNLKCWIRCHHFAVCHVLLYEIVTRIWVERGMSYGCMWRAFSSVTIHLHFLCHRQWHPPACSILLSSSHWIPHRSQSSHQS